METYMETLGCRAKEASRAAAKLTTVEKNRGLEFVAEELCLRKEELLSENEKDMEVAREQGMSEALQDRLRLTEARIEAMAEGLRQIAGLLDPIGEVLSMKNRPNGLRIGKRECRSVLLVLFTNPDQMSQQMRSGCALRRETQ